MGLGPPNSIFADFDQKLILWRRLASSFTYRSLPDCRQTMAWAEGLSHSMGYIFACTTVLEPGAPKGPNVTWKNFLSDFVRIRQLWRRLARSVINRSSPVHHRTISRAECVSVCTVEFSQGHNFWGLGPPKYFLPISTTFGGL